MSDSTAQTPYQRDLLRRNSNLTDQLIRRAYGAELLQEVTADFITCHNLTDFYLAYVDRRLGVPQPERDMEMETNTPAP